MSKYFIDDERKQHCHMIESFSVFFSLARRSGFFHRKPKPVQSILIAQIESNVTFGFLLSMPFSGIFSTFCSITYAIFHYFNGKLHFKSAFGLFDRNVRVARGNWWFSRVYFIFLISLQPFLHASSWCIGFDRGRLNMGKQDLMNLFRSLWCRMESTIFFCTTSLYRSLSDRHVAKFCWFFPRTNWFVQILCD